MREFGQARSRLMESRQRARAVVVTVGKQVSRPGWVGRYLPRTWVGSISRVQQCSQAPLILRVKGWRSRLGLITDAFRVRRFNWWRELDLLGKNLSGISGDSRIYPGLVSG